jgi:hypothetical protein
MKMRLFKGALKMAHRSTIEAGLLPFAVAALVLGAGG